MVLFNFLKRNHVPATSINGLPGPLYLEGLTAPVLRPVKLKSYEWRRQLRMPDGQTWFRIQYYGKRKDGLPHRITGTDFSQPLIYAIDGSDKQVLLFDGCRHGYNALFSDLYTEAQHSQRKADIMYTDADGSDRFEVLLSAYYQFDYDRKMSEEADADGCVLLEDGTRMAFDDAQRNGYDMLQILLTSETGRTTELFITELG